jgi:ComF family protein
MRLGRVYGALAARLLGEFCPRCSLPSAAGFCGACRADFPTVFEPCPRCGLPPGHAACPAAAAGWALNGVTAPFVYDAPLSDHLKALKYRRRRTLGRALGLLLAERLLDAGARRVDALVPVPLHARRLRERSFNQADEIGRSLAAALGPCLLARGIARQRATPAQTGFGPAERRRHLEGAFAVTRELTGLRIAIVDDVLTTGATANALAAALREAGAAQVECWAVARTL